MTGFSVIMPTYNQAAFIRRAISSLLTQTFPEWELIIINDGSTDNTEDFIAEFLANKKIRYIRKKNNEGLGEAINQGLDIAKYDYIAYLPSDDYYYPDHLQTLKESFESSEDIVLTYTIAKSEINDSISSNIKTLCTNALFKSHSLQLVQTAHKYTDDRWVTREQCVTENLFEMFWYKLTAKGKFKLVERNTASWSVHAHQYHKIVSEDRGGGLNVYRQYYNVQDPIKIKVSKHKFIDEEALYKGFRIAKMGKRQNVPLKILIVGELAYNPERIFALEEQGHILYGLWMKRPSFSFSAVGHLPFGNVTDIPYENWQATVKDIKPDIIYATLNFGAITIAHEVLMADLGIPFVWHFKEGPFLCKQQGTWEKLIDLYHKADGKIYLTPEVKEWYEQFIPQRGLSFVLDGDLPKMDYFTNDFSVRLSEKNSGIHTVIPGRAIGIGEDDMKVLASNDIHIHAYVENYIKSRGDFIQSAQQNMPDHFHLHSHCSADNWVSEFSRYDAGWLHCFDSRNKGIIADAGWNDLNMPARMNTLAAAGLPMIQKKNHGHIVAMRSRLEKDNLGICFDTYEELAGQLCNKDLMEIVRNNVLKHRYEFSFDHHVPRLVGFFRKVIAQKQSNQK